MGQPAQNHRAPHLRLVVDNMSPRIVLMPILDVERRLASVRRSLERSDLHPGEREALQEMHALLRCELEARPFRPHVARRCEHRLRWIEQEFRRQRPVERVTLLDRARRVLSAILPTHAASA